MPIEATYRLAKFPRSRLKRVHLVAEGAEKTLCGQTGGRIIGEARTERLPVTPPDQPGRLVVRQASPEAVVCLNCEWLATRWQ